MREPQIPAGRPTVSPIFHAPVEDRAELVAMTRSRSLCSALLRTFGDRLLVTRSWPAPGSLAADVLLIDLAILGGSACFDLVRLSRQRYRPSLVLIDHHKVDRRTLARVAADELLPAEADIALVTHALQEHSWDAVFHAAANTLTSFDRVPYPLNRFLSAAFTDRCSRVGRLATVHGFKQSTLRNQWRRVRADPSIRLEDVLGVCGALRGKSGTMSNEKLRTELEQLIEHMLGKSVQFQTK